MGRSNSFLRIECNVSRHKTTSPAGGPVRLFQLRDMATKIVLPDHYADKAAAQRARSTAPIARMNKVFEIVPGPDHHRYVAPEQQHGG